jgi:ribonuclease BN (tRNA processing enzyme)
MSDLCLIPLGVGEAFTAKHYTACLLVGVNDDWLLLDCPHPIRKMLREGSLAVGLNLDLDHIGAVAVSHLHADHCSGLEDYGYYSHYALRRRARILMHPAASARLWDGLLAAGMGLVQDQPDGPRVVKRLDDFFDLVALSDTDMVESGPFSIECRSTIHPIPTTAFRVRAGGRTLGYSADTAFDPTLIDWLASADLIVHETTTYNESAVHTPYERLAALPAALREKMRLIHYPDDFDHAASVIEPLHQGRFYSV